MMEYEKKIFAMQEANAIMGATIKLQEAEIARLKAELAPTVNLSPCDVCAYSPPSSGDGKPCSMCPAVKKVED